MTGKATEGFQIDWLTILPEANEREFWQALQSYEEERKVTYVSNAERFGFERGVQEGRQKGRQEGIQEGERRGRQTGEVAIVTRQLSRRIGPITLTTETKIRSLSLSQLEELGEALLDFSSSTDLKRWIQLHS